MQEVTWEGMVWHDATWGYDAPWQQVHTILGTMSQHELGWYRGLFDALAYSQAQVLDGRLRELVIDAPEGYTFSPSGTIKDGEGFYFPNPELPTDVETVKFSPIKFLCLATELDREGGITYIRFSKATGMVMGERSVRIHMASTETEFGLPAGWPKLAENRNEDVWRPFRHAAKLEQWLAEDPRAR